MDVQVFFATWVSHELWPSGRTSCDRRRDAPDGTNTRDGRYARGLTADVRVSRAEAGRCGSARNATPGRRRSSSGCAGHRPGCACWRRGIEAAGKWLRETGNAVLRVPYTAVTPKDWGAVGGNPLGQWIADQRRACTAGTLEAGRVSELEQLGMVWPEQETAWAGGVARLQGVRRSARAPLRCGRGIRSVWAKNARATVRRVREHEELRAAGLPIPSAAGAMPAARQDEPTRSLRDGARHGAPAAGSASTASSTTASRPAAHSPMAGGDVIVQGEDLGLWVTAQWFGQEQLLPVQQWILENTLKITPVQEDERPVKQTQEAKWALNLAATRQFHAGKDT
ncbi:helicase associated domain-containing protein [Streptomyces sp. NPDC127117]|uniref:helicase associated domain-containing protein n=1 Tax=Streptomyces sp. NPDC127117 TaxID=3345368 RepID=UPI0036433B08